MKVNKLAEFGIKHAANGVLRDKLTKEPIVNVKFINELNLEVTSDTVYAYAAGEKAIAYKNPSESTLSMKGQIMTFGMLSLIMGSSGVKSGAGQIFKKETLTVESNSATITGTPKEGTLGVAILNSDNSFGQSFKATSTTPKTGEYQLSGKTITFYAGDIKDNTKIMACFLETSESTFTFSVPATAINRGLEFFADTITTNRETLVDSFMQLQVFSCATQNNSTLTFSATDPSEITLTLDVLADPSQLDERGKPKLFDFVMIE